MMTEPEIRYCRTSDGVSVAYTRVGSGPPVLNSDFGIRFAAIPSNRFLLSDVLVDVASVTYFDYPGVGASDRDVTDFSAQAIVRAHEAVADASMPGERFTLIAPGGAVYGALYAAAHPDRVDRLICLEPVPPTSAWYRAWAGDWSAARRVMASMVFPEGAEELQRWWSRTVRDSVSQDTWGAAAAAHAAIDQQAAFARVRVPTLLIAGKRDVLREHAARLAALVPGSQMVATWSTGSPGNDADAVRACLEFMGIDSATRMADADSSQPTAPSTFQTILFTDIEANTELLQRLGDDRWRSLLREHERITREQLAAHSGAEVKHTGDGFMASFGSAAKALECAVAMQRAFAERDASSEHTLRVRIGVNAGEPIAEDRDLFGTAVTMAARIMAQAQGGEVLVSDVVRQLVAGKGFLFTDRGEFVPKGFDESVRLWDVRWQE